MSSEFEAMASPIKLAVSGASGALIGVGTAQLLTSVMIEITETPYFTVLFGLVLLIMGAVLMARALGVDTSEEEGSGETSSKRYFVVVFSIVVLASGLFCFLLDKDWFHSVGPTVKIPMYTLLGVSLAFAVTYTLVELMNMGVCNIGCCKKPNAQPPIGSPAQVFIVLVSALVMGAVVGWLFGSLDVEDDQKHREALARLYVKTLPLGIIIGLVVGILNEVLRNRDAGDEYDILRAGTYNDSL